MFAEEVRHLFEFFNGERTVKADPLVLTRRLYRGLADRNMEPKETFASLVAKDLDVAYGAIARFLPVVREAFDLKPPATEMEVEEGVLTDSQVLRLYLRFTEMRSNLAQDLPVAAENPPDAANAEASPADARATETAAA